MSGEAPRRRPRSSVCRGLREAAPFGNALRRERAPSPSAMEKLGARPLALARPDVLVEADVNPGIRVASELTERLPYHRTPRGIIRCPALTQAAKLDARPGC